MRRFVLAVLAVLGMSGAAQAVPMNYSAKIDATEFGFSAESPITINTTHLGPSIYSTYDAIQLRMTTEFGTFDIGSLLIDQPPYNGTFGVFQDVVTTANSSNGIFIPAFAYFSISVQVSGLDVVSGSGTVTFYNGDPTQNSITGGSLTSDIFDFQVIPLPASGLLLLAGVGAIGIRARRQKPMPLAGAFR